jgi:hypothetical protein
MNAPPIWRGVLHSEIFFVYLHRSEFIVPHHAMFRSLSASSFLLLFVVAFTPNVRAQQAASDTTKTEILTVTSTSAEAPEAVRRKWNTLIFTDFYTDIFQGNISYLTRMGDHFGVGGGLRVPTLATERGVGLEAEARWYPGKRALAGFYVAPNFTFNLYSYKHDTVSYSANAFSAGLMIGYEWIFAGGFAVGAGFGADYYMMDHTATYIVREDGGINPAIRFDLGWAW